MLDYLHLKPRLMKSLSIKQYFNVAISPNPGLKIRFSSDDQQLADGY